MAVKNNIDVIIGGKVLTLSGYESEQYLQEVSSYINHKIAEVQETEGFKHLGYDIKNMFIELNIADDYFKAKKQAEFFEGDIALKEKEIYNLKHDLINVQINLEDSEKTISSLKDEITELQKKIVELETKISDKEKR